MAKKFILDLTKTQLPEPYVKCIKRIPIEIGKHGADWDIIGSELTIEELQILKAASVSGWRDDLPIGIDNEKLPVGAIIEVVE